MACHDALAARKYLGLEGATDESTKKKVNDNMLGKEILWVSQYPEAKLEKATLRASGKTTQRGLAEVLLEGDFTLHRTTKPIRCIGNRRNPIEANVT